MGKRWMEDMGLKWRDMPNFVAHSQADEEHSDMFLPFLEEYATGEKRAVGVACRKRVARPFRALPRRRGTGNGADSVKLTFRGELKQRPNQPDGG